MSRLEYLNDKTYNYEIFVEGEKLVVVVWDAWEILTQRSSNHRLSKASFSSKHKMHAYHRLD